MAERPPEKRKVTGSTPVPTTTGGPPIGAGLSRSALGLEPSGAGYRRVMVLLPPVQAGNGVASLLAVPIALAGGKHRGAHLLAGRSFVVGMLVVSTTGVGMVLLATDIFLFSISLFSGCLAASGWRNARGMA